MELVIETGDWLMQQSRPVKLLSEGELVELLTQLVDLLGRCWIQHPTGGIQRMWCSRRSPMGCGTSATTTWASISQPAVEPLQHINTLLDWTRG
jgi:hypothetical protein